MGIMEVDDNSQNYAVGYKAIASGASEATEVLAVANFTVGGWIHYLA
jgi:hypothetical protein